MNLKRELVVLPPEILGLVRDYVVLTMRLNDPWFRFVRLNIKLYEGRSRMSAAVCALRSGDHLRFVDMKRQRPFYRTIRACHPFATFREALETLPIDRVLPGLVPGKEILPYVSNFVDPGVEVYRQFVSADTEAKHGVVMIELYHPESTLLRYVQTSETAATAMLRADKVRFEECDLIDLILMACEQSEGTVRQWIERLRPLRNELLRVWPGGEPYVYIDPESMAVELQEGRRYGPDGQPCWRQIPTPTLLGVHVRRVGPLSELVHTLATAMEVQLTTPVMLLYQWASSVRPPSKNVL